MLRVVDNERDYSQKSALDDEQIEKASRGEIKVSRLSESEQDMPEFDSYNCAS